VGVVHHVGLDLAWGDRQPTGVAVLDDEGRLLHLAAARTDDDIVAQVAAYVDGPCLVAIDAPLIVTNPTGNRPAEAELNRDFRTYQAGAHPSNTGKPEFAVQPRGARIAARLGLDLDPRSRRPRRAIEVYPHPATIALFGLAQTLKYKSKKGRTLPEMREELLTLARLLESLATADPPLLLIAHEPWRQLVEDIGAATRKSDLRRAEDPVDAVLCAYVGLFSVRRPEATTTYGSLAEGYIVTPTLGVVAPAEPDPVARAVREYAALEPALRGAADQAVTLVRTVLDEAGINYLTVSGRTKSLDSFAAKAARTVEGEPVFTDPMAEIGDVVGVRVITYVRSDVDAVAALLADEAVVHDDRDLGQETASEGRFGYASRHLQIGVADDDVAAYPLLRGRNVQVQIRTVLQHAWAEFEHDIRYKGSIPAEHRADFDRRFTLAAGLLELADQEFSTIRDTLRDGVLEPESVATHDDPRIRAQELAAFLAGQYADASWSRTDHYEWIAGLVLELGISSLAELAEVVRQVDTAEIDRRMGYQHPAGAVRRLDDALLTVYGERYITLHGNAHRVGLLRTRLARMQGL
jgi:predicted RNase H-like nuclease/ppGpp synthetase/RelA/SpoT-type nucleotidyltranferase